MFLYLITDIFFAAIAGIGFGAISNPPKRSYVCIAILAGLGHVFRTILMDFGSLDIASASFVGALVIGFTSLWLAGKIYSPMTVIYIPALLPMIPGKFAYNTIFALIMILQNMKNADSNAQYVDSFISNGTVAMTVVFLLAIGATLPMFIFYKKSHSLARRCPKKIHVD